MRHFKYLKIFLIILLIFSFFLTQGPAYSSQEVIISEQAVEKFANLWKDEYLGRFSEIKDIIKIINEDDEIIGYYVTFDPKGYVVIDIK